MEVLSKEDRKMDMTHNKTVGNEQKLVCTAYKLLSIYFPAEQMRKYDYIYIYGAGMVGARVYEYLKSIGLDSKVDCFFTTNKEGILCTKEIKKLNKKAIKGNSIVLLSARKSVRNEMKEECDRQGISNIVEVNVYDERNYDYYSVISHLAYPIELEYWYWRTTGRELNLKQPKTYNEKIQWLKLYDDSEMRSKLSDKYAVREYVSQRIGKEYLIPLYGVWDDFPDIPWEELPNRFVLKCNHGWSCNSIVLDKNRADRQLLERQFRKWLDTDYSLVSGFEMQYHSIKRKIIAEKYIENEGNAGLWDYKFFVFDGNVRLIQVDIDRFTDHKRLLYSRDWTLLPYEIQYPPAQDIKIDRPKKLGEMIAIAEKLGKGWRHVRVDLYYANGDIFFGEMTFTHGSGTEIFKPEEFNEVLGSYLHLPIEG